MTTLNLANHSELATQIAALKDAGITNIALTEGSGSHIRGLLATTLIDPPSHRELEVLCEAVFGENRTARLRLGGKEFGNWNGCRVTAIVFREGGPYHVGLRLNR